MRLLHISDLHAHTKGEPDQERIVERLLEDVQRNDAERAFNLLVFSGDLAFDGSPEALQRGRELLLDPLTKVLPGRPLVMVPGNHDVHRPDIDPIIDAGLRATLTDRDAVNELLSDDDRLARATAPLARWEAFQSDWYGSGGSASISPLARVFSCSLDGVSVGVAALNTAWRAKGGSDDQGHLILGELQVERALKEIADADVRVVLMHHPYGWLAEFDGVSSRTFLERHGVFVLTGHDHSADPTLEITTRGEALYSRAGCLYSGHAFLNSYTILDLDHRRHRAHISLRRWSPESYEFGAATNLHRGGSFELPWPQRSNALPVHRAALPDVLAPLAEMAQERSVLVDYPGEVEATSVPDLLIAPRFWPIPHREIVGADEGTTNVEESDPIVSLASSRIVIVSGEESSGVTSALLWILDRHFRNHGTHLPAFAYAGTRFNVGRIAHAVTTATSPFVTPEAMAATPVLVAVDDASFSDKRSLVRLVRFLREYPNVKIVLGCHGDDHSTVAETLDAHGFTYERAFLGPFGRRELRELVGRIVGREAREVVDRVLEAIQRYRLPRTPLNIAALVEIVARQQDLTAVNESGLLQSYVSLLLENPTISDPDGLFMDYRRREHLLERFAYYLVRLNVSRLARPDAEQFVLDYFVELGWRTGSAGQLIDSLIRRRVLVQDSQGVGFRYPALLHLFAAKAMLDDEDHGIEFEEFVMSDPVRYREIVRHAAGLKRNARDLLARVAETVEVSVAESAPGVSVSQFDLIKDQHGWSRVRDLDQVRALLESSPDPPTEEELDELYDGLALDPPAEPDPEPFAEEERGGAIARLGPPVRLLAGVLKGSELVTDGELKRQVLQSVISGWSVGMVLLAVREDETNELRDLLSPIFSEGRTRAEHESIAAHVARVLLTSIMTFALYAAAASPHLQGALEEALDDDEFMGDTANALFATMLYSMLGFTHWPRRLKALHDKHGDHPLVLETLRLHALREFRSQKSLRAHQRDEQDLENLLVEILTPDDTPGRSRTDAQNQIRGSLRKARTQERWTQAAGLAEPEDDLLLPP